MHTLQLMFPSLALFSDINWDEVSKEYEADYIDLSFPEYLQQKTLEGNCPPYLFELAYYEMALADVKSSAEPFPFKVGIYLNPTALFLSLEFDVQKMIHDAQTGKIDILERSHVLCLYRDTHDKIHTLDLNDDELELLQYLEDGPQVSKDFVEEKQKLHFKRLTQIGLILDLA